MAAFCGRDHPLGSALVLQIWCQLSRSGRDDGRTWRSSFVIALLTLLCSGLLYSNMKLVGTVKQLELRAVNLSKANGPVVGSRITHLGGVDTTFASTASTVANRGTLVLVFSPDCGYCKANISTWNKVVVGHS